MIGGCKLGTRDMYCKYSRPCHRETSTTNDWTDGSYDRAVPTAVTRICPRVPTSSTSDTFRYGSSRQLVSHLLHFMFLVIFKELTCAMVEAGLPVPHQMMAGQRFTSAYGPSQAAIQEPPTGLILTYHISPAYARPCLHWCIFERPGGTKR